MSTSSMILPDGRAVVYSLSEGDVNAPIILLASSLAMDITSWDRVVPVLHKQGFRTLRYDQPGHGLSGVPADLANTTIELLSEDVHHLLRSLSITKLFAWIGVSLGSMTGIYFVTKYPGVVERLVLGDLFPCSPVNAGKPDTFAPMVELSRTPGGMEKIIGGTMGRWLGADWIAANPEEAERVRQSMVTTTGAGFEACGNAVRGTSYDARPLLNKIGTAVERALLVVGEKDADLPVQMEGMRQTIEAGLKEAGKDSAELKVIPNAGHISFIDGFDSYIAAVTPFLA